jgi:hypothetical protein
MQTKRNWQQIRTRFPRSFCRPVKVRVDAEPPHSADRATPCFPAGFSLQLNPRPPQPEQPRLRVFRPEPKQSPDWRIVGDHDPGLSCEQEGDCS